MKQLAAQSADKAIRLAALFVISLVVFGGLYFVVRLLE